MYTRYLRTEWLSHLLRQRQPCPISNDMTSQLHNILYKSDNSHIRISFGSTYMFWLSHSVYTKHTFKVQLCEANRYICLTT